jgi:hypothetical protein
MTTRITVTTGDGGLVERNAQQQAANRQGAVVRNNANKATAAGTERRRLDRIAAGLNPETGDPLIPPVSATTLARFGSASTPGIPRLNQQIGASRQTTGIEWSCTFADPAFDAYYRVSESEFGIPLEVAAFTCPFRKKGGINPGFGSFLTTAQYGTLVQAVQYRRTSLNNKPYLEAQPLVINEFGATPSAVFIRGSISDTPVRGSSDLAYDLLAQRPITKSLGKRIDTLSVDLSAVIRSPSTRFSRVSVQVYLLDSQSSGEDKFTSLYQFIGQISRNNIDQRQGVSLFWFSRDNATGDLSISKSLDTGIILDSEQSFSFRLNKLNGSHYLSIHIDGVVVLESQLPFPVTSLDCKPIVEIQVFSGDESVNSDIGPVLCGPITVRFN